MIKSNKISSIILLLAALLMLLSLSGEAQTITRNKKKAATTTTAKKQGNQSSKSSETSTKNLPAPIQQLISNMVSVKGGTFTMGATSEQGSDAFDFEYPAHHVKVSSFRICKYEVTQAQWRAVMGKNPSRFKGDNLPVEQVSWDDCQKFIHKLNKLTGMHFRLPTEAEWEYAARGGSHSRGYKYAGNNNVDRVAWHKDNSGNTTHPVGSKSPNELGLFDMSGNVWEWCQDWHDKYDSNSKTNPTGPSYGSYRVNRGGSWDYFTGSSRVSFRCGNNPSLTFDNIGLRLAI